MDAECDWGKLQAYRRVIFAARINGLGTLEQQYDSFSAEYKADREFCKLCVSDNWKFLQYMEPKWKNDRAVVLLAMKTGGDRIFEHVGAQLKKDKTFIKEVGAKYRVLKYVDQSLCGDPEVVLNAIVRCSSEMQYSSDDIKSNRKFVTQAVQTSAGVIEYVDSKLLSKEVLIGALQNSPRLVRVIDGEFMRDRELMHVVVRGYGEGLRYVDKSIIDKQLVVSAVSNDGHAIKYAGEYQADWDVVRCAVEQNWCVISKLDETFRKSYSCRLIAAKSKYYDETVYRYKHDIYDDLSRYERLVKGVCQLGFSDTVIGSVRLFSWKFFSMCGRGIPKAIIRVSLSEMAASILTLTFSCKEY